MRIHPIFKWFEEWCNDEFRHGEAFSLLMRANPHLLKGGNKYWIRFFLLAVFSTMYVRDHARPAFHEALGIDPRNTACACSGDERDLAAMFPVELDIDHPAFKAGLEKLLVLNQRIADATSRAASSAS